MANSRWDVLMPADEVLDAAIDSIRAYCESLERDAGRLDFIERDMKSGDEAVGIEWDGQAFTFPYLVSNAGGFGGGVGQARQPNLRAAIDASQALDDSNKKD
jgi:hypothetical protein